MIDLIMIVVLIVIAFIVYIFLDYEPRSGTPINKAPMPPRKKVIINTKTQEYNYDPAAVIKELREKGVLR